MAGILALYHSLESLVKEELSVLIIDYSLTIHNKTYPTQLQEALEAYGKLASDGYTNINMLGDSAGGNLALVMCRFIAYPAEAKKHFSQFDLQFNYGALPQPKSLVLVSPWVQPATISVLPTRHGSNIDGDLASGGTTMGDWYVNG